MDDFLSCRWLWQMIHVQIASDLSCSSVVIYNWKKYSRGAFLYTSFKSKQVTFTRALLSWLLSWAMWVGRRNLFCSIHQTKKSSNLCVLRRWWHFQSLTSHICTQISTCFPEIHVQLRFSSSWCGLQIVNMTLKALSLMFLNKKTCILWNAMCPLSTTCI